MARKKVQSKLLRSYWVTLFFGATTAYFVWLSWNKLTELIGDSTRVWLITGAIVLFAIIVGQFSFKKLAESFT